MFTKILRRSNTNLLFGSPMARRHFGYTTLYADSNQAQGLANYAIEFMQQDSNKIDEEVYDRVRLFHTDSVLCGVSAIAQKTNAPTILRKEANLHYSVSPRRSGEADIAVGKCFGSKVWTHAEKAIAANCAAVREWDSNGTVFGNNPNIAGHSAGEFGHNDFYPVVVAACQTSEKYSGQDALKAMLLLDEIRGRLCEVFSLHKCRIDHVLHGSIASAVVYGVLMGATPSQIESAVGMVVSHYVPWRAIRSGSQLSDSKGASAALAAEVAVTSVHRAILGYVGPKDVFRNPDSLFRRNVPTDGRSPFDLTLTKSGSDFAVMGMHFKLGVYEHQSAGAIAGMLNLLSQNFHEIIAADNDIDNIQKIKIMSYEPALSIIGDPAKLNPTTRQSADHSMVYIISSILRKAFHKKETHFAEPHDIEHYWKHLMLLPEDYNCESLFSERKRSLMKKIEFEHGGSKYDALYPEGIPTSIEITTRGGSTFDSGLVMFPGGHAANEDVNLLDVLQYKFLKMGKLAMDQEELAHFVKALENIDEMDNEQLKSLYDCDIAYAKKSIDGDLDEEEK